jgi:hypothetical protein
MIRFCTNSGDFQYSIRIIILYLAKPKRASNQMVVDEDVESDDENELSQQRSDDEEFRNYSSITIMFLFCIRLNFFA